VSSDAAGIEALAKRFFDAIEAGDVEAVAAAYADDVGIWHNTDGALQSKAENLQTLTGLIRGYPERRYQDRRLTAFPCGFVQQHTLARHPPRRRPPRTPRLHRLQRRERPHHPPRRILRQRPRHRVHLLTTAPPSPAHPPSDLIRGESRDPGPPHGAWRPCQRSRRQAVSPPSIGHEKHENHETLCLKRCRPASRARSALSWFSCFSWFKNGRRPWVPAPAGSEHG